MSFYPLLGCHWELAVKRIKEMEVFSRRHQTAFGIHRQDVWIYAGKQRVGLILLQSIEYSAWYSSKKQWKDKDISAVIWNDGDD